MERIGPHYNGKTIFRLLQIDMEKKMECRMIQEYEIVDDRGEQGDFLAVAIEFVENHTKKYYMDTL